MKKVLYSLLLVISILIFGGCGSDRDQKLIMAT